MTRLRASLSLWIGIGVGKLCLEEMRIGTGLEIIPYKIPSVAILVGCLENSTGAHACVPYPQSCRAIGSYVATASDRLEVRFRRVSAKLGCLIRPSVRCHTRER